MTQLKNDSLKAHLPFGIRSLVKDLYIRTVDKYSSSEIKKRDSIQFLYGHYLFKDEEAHFHKLIDYLQANYTIISYSEAVTRVSKGEIDGNYICFSFDDGIKNCMRIAEAFYQRAISAMFFLNPLVIDSSNKTFFIQEHCKTRLNLKELDFMDWQDVDDLLKLGHEIGNHTNSHVNIASIHRENYRDEILLSKEALEKKTGAIKHFAWPYGTMNDISPEAFDFIINCGHESIASAIRGQHCEKLDLKVKHLLRDLVVFKDPISYFRFFYNKSSLIV